MHLARQALLNGTERIVCIGGDGTLNEIVNGFMGDDGPIRSDTMLGYIPRGTGCDFIRSALIPKEVDKALDLIHCSHVRHIDLGRITYLDNDGLRRRRYFHNIASCGLGGEVDDRVNRTTKVFGGFLSFIWATLISILLYESRRIHLRVDGSFDQEVVSWHVAVANGQYQGGGMWVAPTASIDDGLFHVTIVGDLSLAEIFRYLPKLYNGKILELEKVESMTASRVEASSDQRVLLDVDGEQPGRLPATFELVPKALPVIAMSEKDEDRPQANSLNIS
jgi:YegS/Rv2252/BmrU family lipid kinase